MFIYEMVHYFIEIMRSNSVKAVGCLLMENTISHPSRMNFSQLLCQQRNKIMQQSKRRVFIL